MHFVFDLKILKVLQNVLFFFNKFCIQSKYILNIKAYLILWPIVSS